MKQRIEWLVGTSSLFQDCKNVGLILLQDVEVVTELFRGMGVENPEVEEVERIGRPDPEKPRLIRYKCEDQKKKSKFLNLSKNLRVGEKFRNVFIDPDLSNSQREINRELRKELRSRREAGEKVRLHRGKIVNEENQGNQLFKFKFLPLKKRAPKICLLNADNVTENK